MRHSHPSSTDTQERQDIPHPVFAAACAVKCEADALPCGPVKRLHSGVSVCLLVCRRGLVYRVHSFDYQGHVVWGLTAAILIQVAQLALGRPPDFEVAARQ